MVQLGVGRRRKQEGFYRKRKLQIFRHPMSSSGGGKTLPLLIKSAYKNHEPFQKKGSPEESRKSKLPPFSLPPKRISRAGAGPKTQFLQQTPTFCKQRGTVIVKMGRNVIKKKDKT